MVKILGTVREGVHKCKFDFKQFGKKLDSYKIFKGGGKNDNKN